MFRKLAIMLLALTLAAPLSDAESYSSGGGRSYSSGRSSSTSTSSSRSSAASSSPSRSSGSSRNSSSGKSYSSGSGRTYSSGSSSSRSASPGSKLSPPAKSSSSGRTYSSGSAGGKSLFQSDSSPKFSSTPKSKPNRPASGASDFSFDTGAARAQKEAASKRDFSDFKKGQATETPKPQSADYGAGGTSRPSDYSGSRGPRQPTYHVTREIYTTRPVRLGRYFAPYYSRPVVVYNDSYNSFFWWWLLDRSLDDRAYWAYHHRANMDAARYQALLASDTNLEARVRQLEAQQVAVNPNHVPSGIDRDLMYTDQQVHRAYITRPTSSGRFLFWLIMVPTTVGFVWFLVWLVFFKRWRTA